MFHHVITSCFLIATFLHTGRSAVIETKETVWAAVGDQASLSCRLTEDKDVLQITWQKVLPDGEKNLATYTKKFGSRVRPDLEEKMDFQYESLQSCSMVIRKVMEEDEGCYRCLFNTYPNGALIGKTCLKLCELHGPFINVSRSNSPPGSVVTCSATGRPVPMVTLTVLHQNLSFSHYNTSRVTNTNGTITSTTTVLLSALNTTQVECSVLVQPAALRELLVTVPGLTETFDDGLDVEPSSSYIIIGLFMVAGLVLALCIAALIFVLLRKQAEKRKHKDTSDINSQKKEDPLDMLIDYTFNSCKDKEEKEDATVETREDIRKHKDTSDINSQEHKDETKINSVMMNEAALDMLNGTLMDGEEKKNSTEERMEDNRVIEEPVVLEERLFSLYNRPGLTKRHNRDQESSVKPAETSDSEQVNQGKKIN
ncbi:PREDICTED: OX-2 membrane glycoprotein-like isoform X1 [Poecilia mexicana]|uniref:OX-2 membrane glycoprotein-like isoform X1 n=1 Tax=Poecilia mexicana TaxID=48701 RepID=UPI00072E7F8B|nr:PREDICTED: OX-2 membrane glycoprotein-like isoform X1 [Poecilia mexicana]